MAVTGNGFDARLSESPGNLAPPVPSAPQFRRPFRRNRGVVAIIDLDSAIADVVAVIKYPPLTLHRSTGKTCKEKWGKHGSV